MCKLTSERSKDINQVILWTILRDSLFLGFAFNALDRALLIYTEIFNLSKSLWRIKGNYIPFSTQACYKSTSTHKHAVQG